jgi:hypothetical protein
LLNEQPNDPLMSLTATTVPFVRVPLYTVLQPPFPRTFSWLKFLVAATISEYSKLYHSRKASLFSDGADNAETPEPVIF